MISKILVPTDRSRAAQKIAMDSDNYMNDMGQRRGIGDRA